jgi:hypothetical protein
MQKTIYKISTGFIIVVFLSYWIISIPLSITKNGGKNKFAIAFPLLNKLVGHSWNFFSGPFYNNDRMYFILRDSNTHVVTDTLEMLEDITSQKRSHAPFNQKENIIDHLISHNVLIIENSIINSKKQLKQTLPQATDSVYQAKAFIMVSNDNNCRQALKTLENYCKMIAAEKKIDTANKEFKIIIAGKSIKPFAQKNNDSYVSKETIYFETAYNNFGK